MTNEERKMLLAVANDDTAADDYWETTVTIVPGSPEAAELHDILTTVSYELAQVAAANRHPH